MTETPLCPSEGNDARSEKGEIVGVCNALAADKPSIMRAFVIGCTIAQFAAVYPTRSTTVRLDCKQATHASEGSAQRRT